MLKNNYRSTLLLALSLLIISACSSPSKDLEPATHIRENSPAQVMQPVKHNVNRAEQKAHSPLHWSYSGEQGPNYWAKLNPDHKTCDSGKEQSPINLLWKKPRKGGPQFKLSYKSQKAMIVDNGHTIKVSLPPQSGNTLTYNGQNYDLLQFHFHSSSEHTLSGIHTPLEAHFVHADKQGNLAVLAVFMIQGKYNVQIDSLFKNIPSNQHQQGQLAQFNPIKLLPKERTHYQYNGSLTTPPCTEGVKWFVLNTPVSVSKQQILHFRKYYSINNRPVQALNKRTVKNY